MHERRRRLGRRRERRVAIADTAVRAMGFALRLDRRIDRTEVRGAPLRRFERLCGPLRSEALARSALLERESLDCARIGVAGAQIELLAALAGHVRIDETASGVGTLVNRRCGFACKRMTDRCRQRE